VLTREARSADLVVIGQTQGPRGAYRSLDPGEAILKMGRPMLVVPEGKSSLRGEHIVIGWKDTREARRFRRRCELRSDSRSDQVAGNVGLQGRMMIATSILPRISLRDDVIPAL
jgi:hypothetical protein